MNGSIRVLICDDVDEIRQLLAEIVELRDGLRVVGEAQNGQEAIDEAKRLQPDVILLDISMPILTGLEALPDIKLAAPAARVIVLSGVAQKSISSGARSRGADRYLEKGARADTIADMIEEVAAAALVGQAVESDSRDTKARGVV
jgi:DNA-binding NarL/FixJ family response regulator